MCPLKSDGAVKVSAKYSEKVVNKFGGDAIIRSVTSGAYDPVTGTASESVSDVELKGVLEDVNAKRGE